MTIEEPFRETTGCRFGVRLEWAQFYPPHYLARFLLLGGVVLVRWTAGGHAVAEQMPSVRLHWNRQGARRSLRRVRMRSLLQLAYQPGLNVGVIQQYRPPPLRRGFAWLQAAEATV
jgi:hypothetical protein